MDVNLWERVDENNCFAPNIPNVQELRPQRDWYNAEKSIRITCDKGYEPKPRVNTVCRDGNWTFLLACEKSDNACSAPSEIPHAVIINQEYKEVFDQDSEVQYECEDGYTVEGGSTKSIWCTAGNWSVGPSCSKLTTKQKKQMLVKVVLQVGGTLHLLAVRLNLKVEYLYYIIFIYKKCNVFSNLDHRPGTGHSGAGVRETGGGHTTSVERETQPGGRDRETRPATGQGGGTTGTIRHPVSGGSSTTSDRPMTTSVDYCGAAPVIANGVMVQSERMFLKYQCNAFYTHAGPDTVMCYADGTWSELPTCKDFRKTLSITIQQPQQNLTSTLVYRLRLTY
ncbi:sushi, von Willebrand factor type A, EGF and pentraxin domain-containing protein 1-like [Mastacembelus armatus]|uniref:sushi, von Willebrand factor type A, EGF and pentraxin domain-containing protein 1-like n=1 Tax=Mastacembelus armatus TaxID=205130 RepID=UPI000E45ED86|nr:sushi, von Willebrand factor type A, EGF and pentraxin domain-containing protein 1-like [Mastacembelus armatus]